MSMRRLISHLLTFAAIGGFALLGAASSASEDGAAEESGPGAANRTALESHLTNGRGYGEGPGGVEIAAAMSGLLDVGLGDAVAVQVIPGTPEQIVVILRLHDLRDMGDGTRQEWLDSFGETVRRDFGAVDSNIVVGIRGNVFFGAVATMSPGATTWNTETGSIVSTRALDEALGATASPSQDGQIPQDIYASIDAADAPYTPPSQDEFDEPEARSADRYTLQLAAGVQVTARMHAPDLDTYLYVLGPDQTLVTSNDDYDEYLNSRVAFSATAAGAYTIVTTTYSAGETGPYALRIRSGPAQ